MKLFKKLFGIGLSVAMVLSVCACGSSGPVNGYSDNGKKDSNESSKDYDDNQDSNQIKEEKLSTEEKYEKFLNNELAADFSNCSFFNNSENKKAYLYTLTNIVSNEIFVNWSTANESLSDINYAYVNIAGSDKKVLAINFICSSDNWGDITYSVVLGDVDDKLVYITQFDAAYRSEAYINKEGVIWTGGSGGAASWYDSYEAIKEDGESLFVYSLNTEYGVAYPVVPSYYLSEVPDNYDDSRWAEDNALTEYIYSFSNDYNFENRGTQYFVFKDEAGNSLFPKEEYMTMYEEQGLHVVSEYEMNKILDERAKELGINREILNADAVTEWTSLDLNKYVDIYGSTWNESYVNFMSDNINMVGELRHWYDVTYFAVEPMRIAGYTIAETNDDGTPELLLLGLSIYGYNTNEVIICLEFDEKTHQIKNLGSQTDNAVAAGNWCYLHESDNKVMINPGEEAYKDSFQYQIAQNYLCSFGVYKNMAVNISHTDGEGYGTWINYFAFGGDVIYSDSDYYGWIYISDDNYEFGCGKSFDDVNRGKEIIENYQPLMFYSLKDENAKKMILDGTIVDDALSHSDSEIANFVSNCQRSFDINSITDWDIYTNDGLKIDVENLCQNYSY